MSMAAVNLVIEVKNHFNLLEQIAKEWEDEAAAVARRRGLLNDPKDTAQANTRVEVLRACASELRERTGIEPDTDPAPTG